MPFQKGVSGNAQGRPNQTPAQKEEKEEFMTLLREATLPALHGVIEIASDKQSRDRLRACQYILDKAFGANTSFLSDDTTEPLTIHMLRGVCTACNRSPNRKTSVGRRAYLYITPVARNACFSKTSDPFRKSIQKSRL